MAILGGVEVENRGVSGPSGQATEAFLQIQLTHSRKCLGTTSDTVGTGVRSGRKQPESLVGISYQEICLFYVLPMNMLFFEVPKCLEKGYSDTFLDLTHLLEGVNGSNLVQTGQNIPLDDNNASGELRSDIIPPNRFKQLYFNGQKWPFWAILTHFWT